MCRRVLVTGSSGFIGIPLAGRLEAAGCQVIRHAQADGDIASCSLRDRRIDHVFHLAARTSVEESWTSPVPFYATNVVGTANVAEFCRSQSASLTMISSYVYGAPRFLPISEEHPVAAFNPYGHSKLLAEEVCRYYARQFHINTTVIRPFNVYGPGQNESFLIPTLLKQVLDPGIQEISIADDRPRRDYLFIDDFLDLLLCTMQPAGFAIFNAGSGSSFSARELAEIMLHISGRAMPVVSRGEFRPREVLDVVADCRKAKDVLGWEPQVPLSDGIRRTIEARVALQAGVEQTAANG
ncbi:MAG: GDP-mannose 4,6-dehydratase [Acidobacteriia bacterium]|nr:GDP-mannose 4,6-dehydratase [Terriglobia bacterium]